MKVVLNFLFPNLKVFLKLFNNSTRIFLKQNFNVFHKKTNGKYINFEPFSKVQMKVSKLDIFENEDSV